MVDTTQLILVTDRNINISVQLPDNKKLNLNKSQTEELKSDLKFLIESVLKIYIKK